MQTTTYGPRPLYVVHQHVGLIGTECGRISGQRRFDAKLGTFVQDSAHLTLYPDSGGPGGVVCPACLGVQEATVIA